MSTRKRPMNRLATIAAIALLTLTGVIGAAMNTPLVKETVPGFAIEAIEAIDAVTEEAQAQTTVYTGWCLYDIEKVVTLGPPLKVEYLLTIMRLDGTPMVFRVCQSEWINLKDEPKWADTPDEPLPPEGTPIFDVVDEHDDKFIDDSSGSGDSVGTVGWVPAH